MNYLKKHRKIMPRKQCHNFKFFGINLSFYLKKIKMLKLKCKKNDEISFIIFLI